MSNDMQTFGLFPTPIWVRQLEPERAEDMDRISISFNIMFKQFGEEIARPH